MPLLTLNRVDFRVGGPRLLEGVDLAIEAGERIALQGRNLDRFEQERVDFHLRVRQAYLERARTAGQRIRVINADRPLAEIRAEVEAAVRHLCA